MSTKTHEVEEERARLVAALDAAVQRRKRTESTIEEARVTLAVVWVEIRDAARALAEFNAKQEEQA